MGSSINPAELAKLPHINATALQGRTVQLIPVWDGTNWNHWIPVADGKLMKIQVVDAARSNYLAKKAAKEHDIHIPFVDLMWQQASWREVIWRLEGIYEDFNLLAAIAAKLEHFHEVRETIDNTLMDSFVRSEIEQLIVVSRSIFDLLQEVIAQFWNQHVQLSDPQAEALRRQNNIPETFSKFILNGDVPKTAEEISKRFPMPPAVIAMYVKHAPFFVSLRNARNNLIHGGSGLNTIFITDKGFCIDPTSKYFKDFPWKPEHYYNSNIVSLRPWVANVALRTIEACNDIMLSLANTISFPEPLAPDYHVFIRAPTNRALLRLLDVDKGDLVWWAREKDNLKP